MVSLSCLLPQLSRWFPNENMMTHTIILNRYLVFQREMNGFFLGVQVLYRVVVIVDVPEE